MIIKLILLAVFAYLLGNLSTGTLVAKYIGHVDIRKTGSGNAGTTNVLRTMGWVPSLLTLSGDLLKGLIPTLIGKMFLGEAGMLVAALFAVLGHNYPVFYGFKGGKGIATSWGAILIINPIIALILLVSLVIIVAVTKIMSVASITGAVEFAVLMIITNWNHPNRTMFIVFSLVYSGMAIFAHRANIQRLMNGTENKLDFAKINKLSKKKSK